MFSEYKKRKLVQSIGAKFVFKINDSTDPFIRKFGFTSVVCTEKFFDNYIANGKNFSYLPKYKDVLSEELTQRFFKLFALQDFKTYIARLEANNYRLDNQEDYEKKLCVIFDSEHLDSRLKQIVQSTPIEDYASNFYSELFGENLSTAPSKEQIDWMHSILLDRLFTFPQLISK